MTTGHYIIGIGNPDRGDDGIGRFVAAQLREQINNACTVLEQDGEISALLLSIQHADAVWLIDASFCPSMPAGTIQRFDASHGPLPRQLLSLSTHGFGLAEAVELARATNTLPAICIVYAIVGQDFEHGHGLTGPVKEAAHPLVERILEEIYSSGSKPALGKVEAANLVS